jgi:hypothetical protein
LVFLLCGQKLETIAESGDCLGHGVALRVVLRYSRGDRGVARCDGAKGDLWSGQSGGIEARTGLRMMPTSPRSPLSFRTAGFPQYGWKAGLSDGAFPECRRLKPAPGIHQPASGLLPPFVHLGVATIFPYCARSRTRSCTAIVGRVPTTQGALARVQVILSWSVIT